MKIKNVVFDFDGTCTQIPVIHEQFLKRFHEELNKHIFALNTYTLEPNPNPVSLQEWEDAKDIVRKNSPKAGWTLAVTSAAPAAADPYILAHEAAKFILRNRRKGKAEVDLPFELHSISSAAHEAPWRNEAKEVIETLLNKKINVYFISNSGSAKITKLLKELLGKDELPPNLKVQSDANKFRISELPLADQQFSLPANAIASYEALPVLHNVNACGRPVFLRRGEYFRSICAVLQNDIDQIKETVFCGDIWEMDLAMPHALGGKIHLVKRASPFDTYEYELKAVMASGGQFSDDLNALRSLELSN
ncbi:MAG: HAD family hydrolase [Ferruginibacter sp.]